MLGSISRAPTVCDRSEAEPDRMPACDLSTQALELEENNSTGRDPAYKGAVSSGEDSLGRKAGCRSSA
jgi:hypothetical protein